MFDWIRTFFSDSGFMPHGHCYMWVSSLLWTHVISDSLIGIAYFCISIILYAVVKRVKMQFSAVVLSFGVFIGACGLTHFMEVWTIWTPTYWLAALVKVVTAIASITTGVWLYYLRHTIVTVAEAAKLSEQRRLDLEALTADLEKRVEERTKELHHAISSRDQFLSIASHELKTPLTSMKLQNEIRRRAMKKRDLDYFSFEKLETMAIKDDQQLSRLTRLVDDMLDISRIVAGKLSMNLEDFDLLEVVNEVVDRILPQAAVTGTDISVKGSGSFPVHWDAYRIEQVLTNLLTNAIRYGSGKPVQIELSSEKGYTQIAVCDSGIGISGGDLGRIFGRFERAVSANEVPGLGLGLFISKEIVEAHGGTLTVESTFGQGSVFKVSIRSHE
jgi:signal transduction histidine kinase